MIKKRKPKHKNFKKPLIRITSIILLSIAALVMFFGFNPIFETYRSMATNNIKYHIDFVALVKNAWNYAISL